MVLWNPFRGWRKTESAFIDHEAVLKKKVFLGLIGLFFLVLILIFALGDRLPTLPFFNRPKPISNQPEIIDIKEFQLK